MGSKKKTVKPRNTAGYALAVVNKIDTFIKKKYGMHLCASPQHLPLP